MVTDKNNIFCKSFLGDLGIYLEAKSIFWQEIQANARLIRAPIPVNGVHLGQLPCCNPPPGEMPIASPLAGEGAKLVQLNFELFSIYLSNLTIYYISIYIYLYLKVSSISKSHKFTCDQCRT
jgi:hypothetical protein